MVAAGGQAHGRVRYLRQFARNLQQFVQNLANFIGQFPTIRESAQRLGNFSRTTLYRATICMRPRIASPVKPACRIGRRGPYRAAKADGIAGLSRAANGMHLYALLVYPIGSYIPVPGIDPAAFERMMALETVRCCRNLVAAIAVRSRYNLVERSDIWVVQHDAIPRVASPTRATCYVRFASTKRRSQCKS